MAVTTTERLELPQWSSGSDPPVNRVQLDGAFASLEAQVAGRLQDVAANRPAAAAEYNGFFFWATDTEVLSYCDGDEWATIPIGAFLALAGGTLAGALNMDGNELQAAVVLNAKDKKTTANVSGAVVIDANTAALHVLTITGNVSSVTINNLDDGETIRVLWIENATGNFTVAFPGTLKWVGGAASGGTGFKTTPNAENYMEFMKIGATIYAFLGADMKV